MAFLNNTNVLTRIISGILTSKAIAVFIGAEGLALIGNLRNFFASTQSLATLGVLSNPDNKNIKLGKAGRNRYLGKRPKVRGVVMNPVDHPHGGGEGRTSGGRHPVTPWGVSTKGKKTRRNKKTNVFIIKRRKK